MFIMVALLKTLLRLSTANQRWVVTSCICSVIFTGVTFLKITFISSLIVLFTLLEKHCYEVKHLVCTQDLF